MNDQHIDMPERFDDETLHRLFAQFNVDDEKLGQGFAGMRDQIRNDPTFKLLEEYILAHPEQNAFQTIRTVEEALAEKALWAFLLTEGPDAFVSDSSWYYSMDGANLSNEEMRKLHVIRRWVAAIFMMRAVPYIWSTEMFGLMCASPLPRHTIQAKIPFDIVWFGFEKSMNLSTNTDHPTDTDKQCDGILATQLSGFIRVETLGNDPETGKLFHWGFDVPQGSTFPDDFKNIQLVGTFLSCLSFINSPYIVLDRKGLQRQVKHRIGVAKSEQSESHTARFILLRSPLYKRDRQESHGTVDWKFRWLVKGHHRAQWCPSTQDHKLMWIAPFVKGPEGAPMKTRAYKVVR